MAQLAGNATVDTESPVTTGDLPVAVERFDGIEKPMFVSLSDVDLPAHGIEPTADRAGPAIPASGPQVYRGGAIVFSEDFMPRRERRHPFREFVPFFNRRPGAIGVERAPRPPVPMARPRERRGRPCGGRRRQGAPRRRSSSRAGPSSDGGEPPGEPAGRRRNRSRGVDRLAEAVR